MNKILVIVVFVLCGFILKAQYGTGQDENPSKGQEQANKGQYEESNNIKGHPYTIFVKTKDEFNILTEIDNIEQILLTPGHPLSTYYENVYTSAVTPFSPADSFDIGGHIKYTTWEIIKGVNTEIEYDRRKGVSPSSIKCKNAAFVYLIGVDSSGKTLRRSTDSDTIAYYNAFKTRAIQRLQWMNVKTTLNIDYMQWRGKN